MKNLILFLLIFLLTAADAMAGTPAYDAPGGDVVMFYGDFGKAFGLYERGAAVPGWKYLSAIHGYIIIEQGE